MRSFFKQRQVKCKIFCLLIIFKTYSPALSTILTSCFLHQSVENSRQYATLEVKDFIELRLLSCSDDSVFRLAANYVMTLFEDYVVVNAAESDGNGNGAETMPLRSTTGPPQYSYGSIRSTASSTTRLGPTRNHTVRCTRP